MYRLIIVAIIVGGVSWRIYAHHLDKRRILVSALDHGWSDIEIRWEPFAPGWFFEGQERLYSVQYVDASGHRRDRYCKVRMLGDVYWRDANDPALPPPPDYMD